MSAKAPAKGASRMYERTKPIFSIGVIHSGNDSVVISETQRMNKALSASEEKNWAPTMAKKAGFMASGSMVGEPLYHSHYSARFRLDHAERMMQVFHCERNLYIYLLTIVLCFWHRYL